MVLTCSQSFIACASSFEQPSRRRQRRRRTREGDVNVAVVIPSNSHLLVSSAAAITTEEKNDSELPEFPAVMTTYLCHAPAEIPSDSEVSFDTSVTVQGLPTSSAASSTNAPKPSASFRLMRMGHRNYTRGNCRAKLVSQNQDTDTTMDFPYVSVLPPTQPLPLMSLSLSLERVHPPLEDAEQIQEEDSFQRPLLWACLKQQLCGLVLLYTDRPQNSNNITSSVHVRMMKRDFSLQTQSIMVASRRYQSFIRASSSASSMSSLSSNMYQILPSTKITITDSTSKNPRTRIPNNHEKIQQYDSSTRQLSPAARYLVDTLQCLIDTAQEPLTGNSSPTRSRHHLRFVLLSGPPGTGKTFAVKSAVQATSTCQLVALQGSHILATGHMGEAMQSLEESLQVANHNNSNNKNEKPTMVFLDEFDALVASESMAAALGTYMDRISADASSLVVLVAATNRVDVIPALLRRRFDHEIVMTPPRAPERHKILIHLLREQAVTDPPSATGLLELARDCVGCVPSDLTAIVRKACLAHVQEPSVPLLELLRQAAAVVGASALRDAAIQAPPRTSWEDIAGDAGGAKKALRQAIEWPRTRQGAFEALGLTPPRGILLYGPPGCAKTTLARAAAGAAGVAFLSLDPADVYASSFVGDAEAVIRRAFALARAASPCILFFDEIDAIVGGPDEYNMNMARGSSAEARVLSTFLNEMDGVDHSPTDGVIVLGATNRPWTLDAALLRPGRLDKIIFVPPPDRDARRALIKRQLQGWPISSTSGTVDLDMLADLSESMTGAEIVGACRDAARKALQQVDMKDASFAVDNIYINESFQQVKPLIQDDAIMAQFRRFESSHKR